MRKEQILDTLTHDVDVFPAINTCLHMFITTITTTFINISAPPPGPSGGRRRTERSDVCETQPCAVNTAAQGTGGGGDREGEARVREKVGVRGAGESRPRIRI